MVRAAARVRRGGGRAARLLGLLLPGEAGSAGRAGSGRFARWRRAKRQRELVIL